MSSDFNLKAYVERIGYDGPLNPTVETLYEVHRHHARTLPFENLNPLLRWNIPLDSESLQHKMVHGRRGGYCFEQNLLLRHALEAIGFTVTGLAARVLSNRPADSVPARTHMLLLVRGDETDYLADAGFGGMTLTEPVKLETDTVQATSHERRRVRYVEPRNEMAPMRDDVAGNAGEAAGNAGEAAGNTGEAAGESSGATEYVMEAGIRDEWRTLFRFTLEPQALSDYEMANFYVSNRPGSHFINGLTAARPTEDGRHGLRNNELAIHDLEGNTERRELTTAAELRDALADLFLLDVPADPKLEYILHRLAAGETIDDE